jgi:hypothetical protein
MTISSQSNKARKRNKDQKGKNETLLSDDILYMENPKEAMKNE